MSMNPRAKEIAKIVQVLSVSPCPSPSDQILETLGIPRGAYGHYELPRLWCTGSAIPPSDRIVVIYENCFGTEELSLGTPPYASDTQRLKCINNQKIWDLDAGLQLILYDFSTERINENSKRKQLYVLVKASNGDPNIQNHRWVNQNLHFMTNNMGLYIEARSSLVAICCKQNPRHIRGRNFQIIKGQALKATAKERQSIARITSQEPPPKVKKYAQALGFICN